MSASSGPAKAAASLFAKSAALTYIVVAVVSIGGVFGALAVLGSFSPGPSSSPTYPVVFYESGLPKGTNFSVTFNGVTNSVPAEPPLIAQLNFSAPDGSYAYSVTPVSGYTAIPSLGRVNVTGQPFYGTIVFRYNETPLGTAFAVGNPSSGNCPSGYTYAANGCQAGDFVYRITVEVSAVDFGNVLFSVKTDTGSNFTLPTGPGGFSVLNLTGAVAAQVNPIPADHPMTMTAGWTVYGDSLNSTSRIVYLDTILLDMGTLSTSGEGLTFVATGVGPYSGTTEPLALP